MTLLIKREQLLSHGIELLKIAHTVTVNHRNQYSAERKIKNCLMKRFCLVFYPQLPTPTVQWPLWYVCIFSTLWIYRRLSIVNHPEIKHPHALYLPLWPKIPQHFFQETLLSCVKSRSLSDENEVQSCVRHNNTES